MLLRRCLFGVLAIVIPCSAAPDGDIFFTNSYYSDITIGEPFVLTWSAGDGSVC